jgi:hypothetical protein
MESEKTTFFKVKLNAHGDVEKYKARLVARGFSQVVGIDYMDFFLSYCENKFYLNYVINIYHLV